MHHDKKLSDCIIKKNYQIASAKKTIRSHHQKNYHTTHEKKNYQKTNQPPFFFSTRSTLEVQQLILHRIININNLCFNLRTHIILIIMAEGLSCWQCSEYVVHFCYVLNAICELKRKHISTSKDNILDKLCWR